MKETIKTTYLETDRLTLKKKTLSHVLTTSGFLLVNWQQMLCKWKYAVSQDKEIRCSLLAKLVTWFQPRRSSVSGRLKATKEPQTGWPDVSELQTSNRHEPAFHLNVKQMHGKKKNANEVHFHQLLGGWTFIYLFFFLVTLRAWP